MSIHIKRGKILITSKVLRGSLIIIGLVIMVSYFLVTNHYKVNITLDSCVDGDTAWFIIDGKKEKVRFLGIDTPEATKIIEEYGEEASSYTCGMLENANEIFIEYDNNSDRYDKYDRLLGWVFVDGDNLSELLVSKGYAEVKYIYGDYKYIDNLCSSQYDAYKNKLGIWNSYKYENNYCNK